MTTYYAIGKYAVDATDAEKVAALKECLTTAAMSLVGEFGVSLADVQDALDEAYGWAEMEKENAQT